MLQNTQAEFVEALLSKDYVTDIVTPLSHLEIYRHTMNTSLLTTLKQTYPLIHALLGNAFFEMAAREYIREYPSRSGNLHDYGEYFSEFLTSYQPVHNLIYLTEVADFEWTTHVIYLAPNQPSFVGHPLSSFTPEQQIYLRFMMNPASALRKCYYPILQIIELCQQQRTSELDLHQGGVDLLILRRHDEIQLIALTPADFAFLQSLAQNNTLSDALQAAELIDPNYPLNERLPAFIQDQILVDCYL